MLIFKGYFHAFRLCTWISYSPISIAHNVLPIIGATDTGTRDVFFSWKSRFTSPNTLDWSLLSTTYSGSRISYKPVGVYTIAHTGGITWAGYASWLDGHQRPALQMKNQIL